jgi:hypothetical protein
MLLVGLPHGFLFTRVLRKVRARGYAERYGNALNPLGQRDRDARARRRFQRMVATLDFRFLNAE